MSDHVWMFGSAIALALVLAPLGAQAQTPPSPEDMETARGVALGTGVRASATSTSALAYNPAGLAGGRLYHLEAGAMYEPAFGRFIAQSAVADSMTSKIAAGMSIRGIFGSDSAEHTGIDGRLALALPLGEAISIGLSGRYMSIDGQGQTTAGVARPGATGFTMDASIRISPVAGLVLAGYGYNLIDVGSPLVPLRAGGGISYTIANALTLGGDVLVDPRTFDRTRLYAGGGVEYLAAGSVPLRLGYSWDQGRQLHVVTGGLGYIERKVGVDISIRQQVSGGSDTTVMASLRYFIE